MAKKRWYAMELNGERFLLDASTVLNYTPVVNRQTVNDVYGRPSTRKQVIFDNWFNWFIANGGYCGVSSHNCNFFSIEGIIQDNETKKWYFCWITRSYNRCIEIA